MDSAVAGPGALFRLQAIRPGAVVTVTAAGRSWRYMVQAVRAYPRPPSRPPAAAVAVILGILFFGSAANFVTG